jgi:methylaspartate ammonia-lyase
MRNELNGPPVRLPFVEPQALRRSGRDGLAETILRNKPRGPEGRRLPWASLKLSEQFRVFGFCFPQQLKGVGIYDHFFSKQDIFVQVSSEIRERLLTAGRNVIIPAQDLAERIRRVSKLSSYLRRKTRQRPAYCSRHHEARRSSATISELWSATLPPGG